MSYPFTKSPTYKEFISSLEANFNCRVSKSVVKVNDSSHTIQFIERDIDGKTVRYSISIADDEEMVTFAVMRSVCNRLNIDPAEFGLTLG